MAYQLVSFGCHTNLKKESLLGRIRNFVCIKEKVHTLNVMTSIFRFVVFV